MKMVARTSRGLKLLLSTQELEQIVVALGLHRDDLASRLNNPGAAAYANDGLRREIEATERQIDYINHVLGVE